MDTSSTVDVSSFSELSVLNRFQNNFKIFKMIEFESFERDLCERRIYSSNISFDLVYWVCIRCDTRCKTILSLNSRLFDPHGTILVIFEDRSNGSEKRIDLNSFLQYPDVHFHLRLTYFWYQSQFRQSFCHSDSPNFWQPQGQLWVDSACYWILSLVFK